METWWDATVYLGPECSPVALKRQRAETQPLSQVLSLVHSQGQVTQGHPMHMAHIGTPCAPHLVMGRLRTGPWSEQSPL